MDPTLFLFLYQEVTHFRAGTVVEDHQVEGQACVSMHRFKRDFQHIQGFGVEPAQKRNVVQQCDRDPLGADHIFDELSGVLAFSHIGGRFQVSSIRCRSQDSRKSQDH